MDAAKANAVLGQLSRRVSYRDSIIFIGLYKTFVRPHLEYCTQAWSPWNLGGINTIEAVKKQAVAVEQSPRSC